jgi:hypothetical protein
LVPSSSGWSDVLPSIPGERRKKGRNRLGSFPAESQGRLLPGSGKKGQPGKADGAYETFKGGESPNMEGIRGSNEQAVGKPVFDPQTDIIACEKCGVIEFTEIASFAYASTGVLNQPKVLFPVDRKVICVHCGTPLDRTKEPMTTGKLMKKGKQAKSLINVVEGGDDDPLEIS